MHFFNREKHSPYRISILVGIFLVSIISGVLGGAVLRDSTSGEEQVRPPIIIEDRTRSQTSRTETLSAALYTSIRPSILSMYRATARDLQKPWAERVLPQSAFLGYAIALTSDGWIASSVRLSDDDRSTLLLIDAEHNTYRAEKLISDPATPVRYINIGSAKLKAVQMASEVVPSPQDGTIVSDIDSTLEELSILAYPLPRESSDAVQSTESLVKRFNPSKVYGVSGLPVVNAQKEVLGITSSQGVIPIQYISRGVRAVLKSGAISRPKAGLRYLDNEHLPLIPTPPNQTRTMTGATVVASKPSITISTPTGTARLFAGDIITAVNADTVNGQRSLSELLNEYQPGDGVQLTVHRGETTLTITMLLQ